MVRYCCQGSFLHLEVGAYQWIVYWPCSLGIKYEFEGGLLTFDLTSWESLCERKKVTTVMHFNFF